jgi:hypothetical protein
MAVETVQPDRREIVASAAKLFFVVHRQDLTLGIPCDMAVDTARQAMLGGADTAMHRLVALVFDHFHVITAHEIGRLHAAPFLRGLRSRGHERTSASLDGQGQQGPGQTQ